MKYKNQSKLSKAKFMLLSLISINVSFGDVLVNEDMSTSDLNDVVFEAWSPEKIESFIQKQQQKKERERNKSWKCFFAKLNPSKLNLFNNNKKQNPASRLLNDSILFKNTEEKYVPEIFDTNSFVDHPFFDDVNNFVKQELSKWANHSVCSSINDPLVHVKYDRHGNAISKKLNPLFDKEVAQVVKKFAEYSYVVSLRDRKEKIPGIKNSDKVYYIEEALHSLSVLSNSRKLEDGTTFDLVPNSRLKNGKKRFKVVAVAPVIPTRDGIITLEATPGYVTALVLDRKNEVVFIVVACKGSQGTELGDNRGEKSNIFSNRAGIVQNIALSLFFKKGGALDANWQNNFNAVSREAEVEKFGDKKIKFHAGFYNRFKYMSEAVTSSIDALLLLVPSNMRTSVKFLVTGHSQGAGFGSILAAHISHHLSNQAYSFSKNPIWLNLLSAPRSVCGIESLVNYYELLPMDNIVNQSGLFDIVSCTSFGTGKEFLYKIAGSLLNVDSGYLSLGHYAKEDTKTLHKAVFEENIKVSEKKEQLYRERLNVLEKASLKADEEDALIIQERIDNLKKLSEKSKELKTKNMEMLKKVDHIVKPLNRMYEIYLPYKESNKSFSKLSLSLNNKYLIGFSKTVNELISAFNEYAGHLNNDYNWIIGINHYGSLKSNALEKPIDNYFSQYVVSEDINGLLNSSIKHQNIELKHIKPEIEKIKKSREEKEQNAQNQKIKPKSTLGKLKSFFFKSKK